MDSQPRPNIFVVGAMKSGTTTLHSLLAAHPDIFMSEPKEPCYFIDSNLLRNFWPEMWEFRFWESEEKYLSLFSDARGKSIIGESSTDYSKAPRFPDVPGRILEFNPHARIIYIMRDPVERTISHYWHMVMHRGERRSVLEAVKQDPHYLDVSHYAMQLRPYIETFGLQNILVLTFEQLKQEPLEVAASVYKWLGVQSDYLPKNLGERDNVTPTNVQQIRGNGFLQALSKSRLWGKIGHLVPSNIRSIGNSLAVEDVSRDTISLEESILFMRPIQLAQTEELCELLGRDFPEWGMLYGTS